MRASRVVRIVAQRYEKRRYLSSISQQTQQHQGKSTPCQCADAFTRHKYTIAPTRRCVFELRISLLGGKCLLRQGLWIEDLQTPPGQECSNGSMILLAVVLWRASFGGLRHPVRAGAAIGQ